MASESVKLSTILRRSASIMNVRTADFLNFSYIVFLYPLGYILTIIAFPGLLEFLTTPSTSDSSSSSSSEPTITGMDLCLVFLFLLVGLISSVLGIRSVTHKAFQGYFHGRPVKPISAGLASLLGTVVMSQLAVVLVVICFGFVVAVVLGAAERLSGHDIQDWPPGCISAINGVAAAASLATVVSLQVLWGLALAVVVAESRWGLGALMRSSRLVKGMGVFWVLLDLMRLFWVLSFILGLFSWIVHWPWPDTDIGWRIGWRKTLAALISILQVVVIIYYTVAIAVVYCEVAPAANVVVEEVSDPTGCVILVMEDDEKASASASASAGVESV